MMHLRKFFHVFFSKRFIKAFFIHGVFPGVDHRVILSESLAMVIDIGSNRGQFALAVKRWASKARVIAFEPLAVASCKFRKVFYGESEVTLHQSAIGPQSGTTTIHVSAADDSSSLLSILPLQEQLFPGTHEIRLDRINIAPLSDFVAPGEIVHPAMLKIDVQGYELESLRGCEDLLYLFTYIYVECSFVELYSGQALADEIINWLRKRDWCLNGIYNMTYDRKGNSIQADFLFKNFCLIPTLSKPTLQTFSP